MMTDLHTVVIGAGAAGLSVSALLSRKAVAHVLLEQADQAGGLYMGLHPDLQLLSPPAYNALPEMALPHRNGEIGAGQFADYLRGYIQAMQPPLVLSVRVSRIAKKNAGYEVCSEAGQVFTCKNVVVATGMASYPKLLDFPLPEAVEYQAARDWQGVDYYAGKRVLIVGSGISAVELAELLAGTTEVTLAVNRTMATMPLLWLGVNFHYFIRPLEWLPKALLPNLCRGRFRERAVVRHGGDFLHNGQVRLVELMGQKRNTGYTLLKPEELTEFDVVINATGYYYESEFLPGDVARAENGNVLTRSCESLSHPGLFMIGHPCAGGIDSPFLRGIRRDAYRIARRITKQGEKSV
jgi:putative flavoprotein involved in K+ transport